MGEKRIAWAITGAGHVLEDCIQALLKGENVDIFLSRAADEVVRKYKLHLRIDVPSIRTYREGKASSPLVARLFAGAYSVLVVAPATSNSVAKFVHGISDSLVTNLFAQAGKSGARHCLPSWHRDALWTSREPVKVYPRPLTWKTPPSSKPFRSR
jgi:flavoprotein